MKKLLVFLCATVIGVAFAETKNITWSVDGTTYATSTCEVGGDLIIPQTNPTKYGYHFVGWDNLYTFLEYIESTGTQWIDTGFIANNGMVLDAKAMPIDGELNIGSIDDSGNADRANYSRNLISYTGGKYYPQKLDSYQASYTNAGTTPVVIHLDTTGTKFYCTIYGNVVVDTTTGILQNQTTTVKLGYSDYTRKAKKGRYYYVQIKDSTGILVRDFIPVRIHNGSIGMYDKVTTSFFPNAGTGEFIAGPAKQ